MSYKAKAQDVRTEAAALYKAAPEAMTAFHGLMKSVSKDGALLAKTKELMAVAIAIATGCEGCIVFHVQNAIRHGASRNELAETIAVAVEMGGGPATIYGGKALGAFDELSGESK
jgi:AhpD family alkylhydroperoxidase